MNKSKALLIGIDANEANLTPNRVGINEYAFNLLHAIYELKTQHSFIIYLKTPPQKTLPPGRWDWKYRVIPFPKLWTQTRLPWDLYFHRPRPDVFFSMSHYAPRFSPIPTVISIMDLGFLRSKDQFTPKDFNQLKNWTSYSAKQAKKILTISEYSKQDIVKTYAKNPSDVVVTHLAPSPALTGPIKAPQVLKKYGITKPYFLFLGSLKPNKNVEGLIRAFSLLEPKTYNLVISGKKAWLYQDIFNTVNSLDLQDRVIFTGFVEEDEKPALLSQSAAFVMPSFFEGFGIPVLEAMFCQTPVVLSDVASLPEVAGDAGIYVDPRDINSIVKGMQTAISERDKYVQLGSNRVKLFSWAKTAQATLECLETATTNR